MDEKPRNIAPLIFDISSMKKWTIYHALLNGAWIGKIAMNEEEFSINHVRQFIQLWIKLQNVNLQDNIEDTIV